MIPPTKSKTIFDATYAQRITDIKAVDRDNCHKSKWFQQDAYTSCEIYMQMLTTFMMMLVNYVIIGFKYRVLIIFMQKCPAISPTPWLCEGVGSLIVTFTFMYLCFILALIQKSLFYKVLGMLLGMETLTMMDHIQLWDVPANPEQVPSVMVLKKTVDMGENANHGAYLRSILNRMDPRQRNFVKIYKYLGKYFIQFPNAEEKEKIISQNTAVIEDIRSEKEAIDFCLKLKACTGKGQGECPIHYYYFPNYSSTEVAISFAGHHCLQDGMTQLQSVFSWSDQGIKDDGYYPFFKIRPLNILQWIMIYVTFPYTAILAIKHYMGRAKDKNCINKHPLYMTGEIKAQNSLILSTNKTKALAKKSKASLNEFIMALTSMTLHEYCKLKGDMATKEISVCVPFSFKTVPAKVSQYTYGNDFASMTLYMRLESDLEKAVQMARKLNGSQVRSMSTGIYLLMKMYSIFYPLTVQGRVFGDAASKHTFTFTNVPAYVKPISFGGCQLKRMFFLATAPGALATTIGVISVMNRIQFNVLSDTAQIDDIDAFIGIFNKLVEKHGIQFTDDEED